MANFLTKAILSLVMDKKARETLEKAELGKAIDAAKKRKAAADPSLPSQPAPAIEPGKDRRSLIEDAMAVRRDKLKALDGLDPQARLKLQAMALKTFKLETDKKNGGKGK